MTGSFLELRGLTKHFEVPRPLLSRVVARAPPPVVRAVEEVSLELPAGETLGVRASTPPDPTICRTARLPAERCRPRITAAGARTAAGPASGPACAWREACSASGLSGRTVLTTRSRSR